MNQEQHAGRVGGRPALSGYEIAGMRARQGPAIFAQGRIRRHSDNELRKYTTMATKAHQYIGYGA